MEAPQTPVSNPAMQNLAAPSQVAQQPVSEQRCWTDERVNAKVTKEYVCRKLKPLNCPKLLQPMAFGDDLTDATYLEWILSRGKRLFFILAEIGAADEIFRVLDNAWDDSELPAQAPDMEGLALVGKPNENTNRKFLSAQAYFIHRPLAFEKHISYLKHEVIPLHIVQKLPAASALQSWPRVQLQARPKQILVRRKVALPSITESIIDPEANFKSDVRKAQSVQHRHIADVWASYTSKGVGHFLTSFECEHTLKSFIEFRIAASVQTLSKTARNRIDLSWLHCLADALATMHHAGQQHTAICPSNIVIDGNNKIAFSDIGSLKSFQTDKRTDPAEVYIYGAPEQHGSNTDSFLNGNAEPFRLSPAKLHKHNRSMNSSISSSISTSQQSSCSSFYSQASSVSTSPPSLQTSRSASTTSVESPETPKEGSPAPPTRAPPPLPKDDIYVRQAAAFGEIENSYDNQQPAFASPPQSPGLAVETPAYLEAEQADIFSLGCVFLDILTHMLRKKLSVFITHRSTKRRLESPNVTGFSQPSAPSIKVDSSFHFNLHRVISWTELLDEEAALMDDITYRAVPRLVRLVRCMMSPNPAMRPCAAEVRERIYDILVKDAGFQETCCHTEKRVGPPKRKTPRLSILPECSRISSDPSPTASTASPNKSKSPDSIKSHGGFGTLVRGLRWASRKQSI